MSYPLQRGRFGVPFLRAAVLVPCLVTVGLGSGALAASPTPRALGESGVSVEPAQGVQVSPWLVYELDPGSTRADEIVVANDSSQLRNLDLYPADSRTSPTGVFTSDLKGVAPKELGAWITLDTAHIDLQPHTRQRVHLVLSLPKAADAGEYEASILAQFETSTDQHVQIVHRIGLRVYLTARGSLEEGGRIESVTAGSWWERGWPTDPVVLLTRFRNTGKVHLKVGGTVSSGGASTGLNDGSTVVVPRNSGINLYTTWSKHPWLGAQHIDVTSSFSNREHHTAAAPTDVLFIPWKLILLVLAVVALVGYIARSLWHLLRRGRTVTVNLAGVSMRMAVITPDDYPVEVPPGAKGQKTVVIGLRVHNGGTRAFRFAADRFQLLDSNNVATSPAVAPTAALPNPETDLVNPTEREIFVLAFYIPAAAVPRAGVYAATNGKLIIEMVPWQS